jgi:hypothetical protein
MASASDNQFTEDSSSFRDIRCLKKDFYEKLMTKKAPNDLSLSINEQIAIEELVKKSFEDFVERSRDDSE